MAARVTIGDVEVLLLIDMVPPPYGSLDFFHDLTGESWGPSPTATTAWRTVPYSSITGVSPFGPRAG